MSAAGRKIHAKCRELGIDEDGRRAIYLRVVGKDSQTEMSEAEKEQVFVELSRLGSQPDNSRRPDGRLKLSGRFAGKLQALWIAGWNLGIFQNRDDAALEAFVKRQTKTPENPEGLSAVRFCKNATDARKAIEALKAILAREGGVDWSAISEYAPLYRDADGYRVARAQTKMLGDDLKEFEVAAYGISTCADQSKLWVGVMNRLGVRVRAAKKAGA